MISGQVFRAVDRTDRVRALALSEKVVWQLLQQYATAIGAPGIAPHDLRRYAECRIMPNPNATMWPGRLRNGPLIEVGLENDAA